MQHFIATYGYAAVFVLMLAESACIPVPSELIMTFAGALAGGAVAGTSLSLTGVVLAGLAGNVAGSYVAWSVGRYGGQPALLRWGPRLWIRRRELDQATRWFDRYGPEAVLIGRVLPVVRTFISLPAGIVAMPPARFGLYTTLGCLPWTAALAVTGYEVGANWAAVVDGFRGPTYVIAGLVLVSAAVATWRLARARGGGTHAEGATDDQPGHVPAERPTSRRRGTSRSS